MKIPAKLALSQLKVNRSRSVWTLLGIILSVAAITAIFGFVASGHALLVDYTGTDVTTLALYTAALSGITAVLVIIILFATCTVISNAFRVSAAERTTQFGILKSVGATKHQIVKTVLYEGLWLCVLGIPVGLGLGLLVHFSGIQIANELLGDVLVLRSGALTLKFIPAWQAILSATAVATGTVLLSAWLPARKAANIPAMDAIRGAGEVKVEAEKRRAGRVMGRLFGFTGELASRSARRNKRNLRATVVSLAISIILCITGGSIAVQMNNLTALVFPDVGADVIINFRSETHSIGGSDENGPKGMRYAAPDAGVAQAVTDKLVGFSGASVFGVGSNVDYKTTVQKELLTEQMQTAAEDRILGTNTPQGHTEALSESVDGSRIQNIRVTLFTVDTAHYAALCEKAGVPAGSNILLNHFRYQYSFNNKHAEFEPLVYDGRLSELSLSDDYGATITVPLHGELGMGEVPDEVLYIMRDDSTLAVLVPADFGAQTASGDPQAGFDVLSYSWFVSTESSAAFSSYADGFVHSMVASGYHSVERGDEAFMAWLKTPDGESFKAGRSREPMPVVEPEHMSATVVDGVGINVIVQDLSVELARTRNMTTLMMLPVFGFVGVLTLIALTNIISTISTNVRSRSREFAVLRSVGMTFGELRRMLSLESVSCSIKALVIGLPLGLVASYLVYYFITQSAGIDYEAPWLTILGCLVGVFVVMLITTRFATARLRNSSIIDTIRTNDGM